MDLSKSFDFSFILDKCVFYYEFEFVNSNFLTQFFELKSVMIKKAISNDLILNKINNTNIFFLKFNYQKFLNRFKNDENFSIVNFKCSIYGKSESVNIICLITNYTNNIVSINKFPSTLQNLENNNKDYNYKFLNRNLFFLNINDFLDEIKKFESLKFIFVLLEINDQKFHLNRKHTNEILYIFNIKSDISKLVVLDLIDKNIY